ncbi:MAG: segregation/condensation protein A [Christensenellaceae bacterium]|nr:segregation/condensation protein A [Christensenellaceae bacterium]
MQEINIKLNNFDGPFDLLLHLISKAQISIYDIFISEITEQYIKTVYEYDEINMNEISAFLTMAARLVEIKSKALLPKQSENEDVDEDKKLLIIQLEEYKKIKYLSGQLRQKENAASFFYTKLPEDFPLNNQEFVLVEKSVKSLSNAILRIVERKLVLYQKKLNKSKIENLNRENITVKQGIINILKKIKKDDTNFCNLFELKKTKEFAVTYFIAMLELIRLGKVKVKQKGIFNNIKIFKKVKKDE